MLIAKFPDGISEITVNGLHQWNYGQQLQIEASDLPALFEVHFAHPGIKDAIVRTCAAINGVSTVAIPDVCLEQSRTIQAWIYEINEAAGKTTKTIRLNVIKRVRPAVGGDIPVQKIDKYTEAVTAMNELIAKMPEQFLPIAGGEIKGSLIVRDRIMVDGDMLEVGNIWGKPNAIQVSYLSGQVIGVLSLFGNGSYANKETDKTGIRGLYDHILGKNVIEIGKDDKVKFYGEADSAKNAKTAESAEVAGVLNVSPDNILFDAKTSGAAKKVSVPKPGLYALFIRDEINNVNISQTVYVYNLSRSFNVSIPGGTLVFETLGEIGETDACFRAISSDLQYNFDILSVVKIASI